MQARRNVEALFFVALPTGRRNNVGGDYRLEMTEEYTFEHSIWQP